jgi:hypothetical protein
MSKVTAKVKVGSRVDAVWNRGTEQEASVAQLGFMVDYADGRNTEWAAATPSLSVQMTVKREIADEHFPLGRAVTLTFEPSED